MTSLGTPRPIDSDPAVAHPRRMPFDVAPWRLIASKDAPPPRTECLPWGTRVCLLTHASATMAGSVLALIEHPDQWRKLKADPRLVPAAVDEMVRRVSPVEHFFRTATEDYTLRGKHIKAGDALMMCYPSANRDEEVFDAAFEFRAEPRS